MKAWKTHACLMAILTLVFSATAAADIKVYAASSMTNAIDDIAQAFEDKYGIAVTPVYGGSSSIARQIINGAPADVFISANTKWMKYLVDSKHVDGDSVTNLVRNSLVIIAPKDSKIPRLDISDLNAWNSILDDSRLSLGNPASVPAGMYAKESLTTLGLWDKLKRKVAPAKNVRLALAFVERGESPLGVVYKTDALLSAKVRIVGEFSNEMHTDIVYPVALVKDSPNSRQFLEYLQSSEANKVFVQYGFQ